MGKKNLINRTVLIHFLCWGLVLAFPLFFYHPTDPLEVTLKHYVRSLSGPLGYMIVFYVNYFYLVPKFLFENKRNQFFLFNVILIFLTVSLMTWWWHMFSTIFAESFNRPRMGFNAPPKWVRFMQLALMLVLVIGLCVAVRMSQRMSQLHAAKKEAERTRTEAELKNLRNQLNPHFLLNTLNNIYALIAFDPDKAQMAVGELSKLLRHALYDNQKKFVPLYKEVEFIKNYIELMKIRVTNNVKINSQIDVDNEDSTPIAPLIFISPLHYDSHLFHEQAGAFSGESGALSRDGQVLTRRPTGDDVNDGHVVAGQFCYVAEMDHSSIPAFLRYRVLSRAAYRSAGTSDSLL